MYDSSNHTSKMKMEKSFLKILGDYFDKKTDEEILVGNSKNIVIPIEWLFTEGIDRETIEQAMIGLLKQRSSSYDIKAWHKGNNPQRLKEFEILHGKHGASLLLKGADEWSKVLITDDTENSSGILRISEEEFCKAILLTLKSEDRLKNPELYNKEELESLFTGKLDKLTLKSIKESMQEASNNLTEYYEYLINEKKEATTFFGEFTPRVGTASVKTTRIRTGEEGKVRINPIIPFTNRFEILKKMKPDATINMSERDSDGKISKGAYIVYMYNNPQNRSGKLLVAEPLEGSHATRIIFLNDKKLQEKHEQKRIMPTMIDVVKPYLEMPIQEFRELPATVTLSHGKFESFKERLEYYVQGKKGKNIEINIKHYEEIMSGLYTPTEEPKQKSQAGQPRKTSQDVKKSDSDLELV